MKIARNILCSVFFIYFLACSGGPTIPNKKITLSNSTSDHITVTWAPADGSYLYYRVLLSKSNNISDIAVAEANAISNAELVYQQKTTQTISVEPNTEYFVNVIVSDKDQGKSLYEVTHFTSTDEVAPTVDNSTLTLSGETVTTIDVAWNAAVDANEVTYKVVYSTSNTISTLTDAEANGTTGMDYTDNTFNTTITGLVPSTMYYFNVIAKDAVGNKTIYTSNSASTTFCFIANTLITMADGGQKKIVDVRAGDMVKSFDEHGNIETSTVENVLSKKAKDLVTMTSATSTITGTPTHPFFTDSRERQNKKYPGYRNLGDFVQGDSVKTIGDGTTLGSTTITSVAKTKKAEINVYNLHIGKGSRTYFANGFAVHNK